MNDHEKLIEEAANERYPDIEVDPDTFPTGWSREQERNAFIAGAVFEKALTPTSDEREVLAYLITSHRFRERGLSGAIGEPEVAVERPLAEFLHREGFRRSDPASDDEREALIELLLDAGVHADADDDHVFCSGVADRILAFRRSEVPEPSTIINDGTDDAWQTIADALGNLGYELDSHEDAAAWVQQYLFTPEPQGEPNVSGSVERFQSPGEMKAQGEPSDALPVWERPEVIEAARLAYQGAYEADYDAEDCIAFALRAAGGVR